MVTLQAVKIASRENVVRLCPPWHNEIIETVENHTSQLVGTSATKNAVRCLVSWGFALCTTQACYFASDDGNVAIVFMVEVKAPGSQQLLQW